MWRASGIPAQECVRYDMYGADCSLYVFHLIRDRVLTAVHAKLRLPWLPWILLSDSHHTVGVLGL